jgi:hypothetical protein
MFELGQMLVLSVSAAIAAAAFTYSVVVRRNERRDAQIMKWQRGVVHSIFQVNKAERLTFDDIIKAYRSEAAAAPKNFIEPEKLTSAALRQILLDLIAARVIDQLGEDGYTLNLAFRAPEFPQDFAIFMREVLQNMESDTKMRAALAGTGGIDAMMDELRKRTFGDMDTANQVLALVSDDPSKYGVSDLVLRLTRASGLPPEAIQAQIVRLLTKGELFLDGADKLFTPISRVG